MERQPLEVEILERIEADERTEIGIQKQQLETEQKILASLTPRLTFIKIRFSIKGEDMSAGPVTLVVGQVAVASVVGFDQNGNPFTGTIPTPTWAIDQAALDTIAPDVANPANEDVTSVSVGTANMTATVQGPAGPLTDVEQVINQAAPPPPQVLSSIKIVFTPPAAAAEKKA